MTALDDLGAPEFSIVNKRKLNTTPHYVYVARDRRGHVLYVGQTRNVPGRMSSHRKLAVWWSQAARIDFYRCESRVKSFDVEARLIGELRPQYNRTDGNWMMLRRLDLAGFEEVADESVELETA